MPFTDQWDAGLDSGTFAATLCPVWGMGYIQSVLETAGGTAEWDVADIPGPGGSWGGAFYAMPAQGTPEQRRESWDFLSWLIQPEQQLRIFQATGSLPSQPALYTDDSVKNYAIPFFNDAPVGNILAKAVTELPTQTVVLPQQRHRRRDASRGVGRGAVGQREQRRCVEGGHATPPSWRSAYPRRARLRRPLTRTPAPPLWPAP